MPSHRPAAVAGLFYPADAAALRAGVERRLAECGAVAAASRAAHPAAPPKLIVVPHAGHAYSGACAARAYALLAPWRDRITRVVLLGPTHRVAVRGLAVPTAEAFDTPLGAVPLDAAAIGSISDLPQVVASDRAHAQEHAIEVQLPFLQAVLGRFALVPLAVGLADAADVAAVVERLWGGPETLVVVSTDLSHFLGDARASALDAATVDRILRFDDTIGHDEACGATPLGGALRVAHARGLVPELLDLRHSGHAGGDPARVVGYAALAFWPAPPGAARGDDAALGRALIGRARNAIAAALGLPPRAPETWHPALGRPGAVFVTLTRDGVLRGCVGRLEPDGHPLDDAVRAAARSAAFEDPRFPPLAATEWPDLAVEVSLLGPLEPVAAASEDDAVRALRPGEDGVVLEHAGRRGTYLPQVWAQLPEPRAFLAELRSKAGLPRDGWPAGTRLWRYRVSKFDEPAPRGRP